MSNPEPVVYQYSVKLESTAKGLGGGVELIRDPQSCGFVGCGYPQGTDAEMELKS
jgi:hypothetical protein